MRAAVHWKDYELLDASSGERLERWGEILLIRPDPQILWDTPRTDPLWQKAHARYHRSGTGGGHWERLRPLPDVWIRRSGAGPCGAAVPSPTHGLHAYRPVP